MSIRKIINGKCEARIIFNKKTLHLGRYDTEAAAFDICQKAKAITKRQDISNTQKVKEIRGLKPSICRGVHFRADYNSYIAYINICKKIYLGSFKRMEDAIAIRKKAVIIKNSYGLSEEEKIRLIVRLK